MGHMSASRELRDRLLSPFTWRGDRWHDGVLADVTGWWRDPVLLHDLATAMAAPFRGERPTVVLGLQSRGVLLGALVAQELGVGLIEVRKDPSPAVRPPPRHAPAARRRCLEPPRDSRTPQAARLSPMSRALGTDRASRSSLGTTRVSPAGTAARAWSRPGRARRVPVRPWSR